MNNSTPRLANLSLAVIGLGYVGLPLAVAFSRTRSVVGFDVNQGRIEDLCLGFDSTCEVDREELLAAQQLTFTSNINQLGNVNCFIIAVPTPLDFNNSPDLTSLEEATKSVGSLLKAGDLVIYESTVFPGATEEVCVPLLEQRSGLSFNENFFVGYSPERINPGDKEHRISDVVKVTSGSTEEVATIVDALYGEIISAGTHKAPSIKVAEAAKVIENTQRDLNIALANELSMIFNLMDIDTKAVMAAASTKWNFSKFSPGLVGGHCIGVDPYYLTFKAEALGYNPEMILAGRRINESMAGYVVSNFVAALAKKALYLPNLEILILGLTFKENCPDIRNSQVVAIFNELSEIGCHVDVYDPWVSKVEASNCHGIQLVERPRENNYDGIILAVAHDVFMEMGIDGIRSFGKEDNVLFDLKSMFDIGESDFRL